MTTIIGLTSNLSNEVILLSDLQGTSMENGYKSIFNKLMINQSQKVAFGTAGMVDNLTKELWEKMISDNIDFEKVVKDGVFYELKEINEKRWDGKIPEKENVCSILLAMNFDKPMLYTCWPMGKVEFREQTWIGSGNDKVKYYFDSKRATNYVETGKELILKDLHSRELIEIGYHGLEFATKHDLYSNGLDAVVVQKDKIISLKEKLDEETKRYSKRKLKILTSSVGYEDYF